MGPQTGDTDVSRPVAVEIVKCNLHQLSPNISHYAPDYNRNISFEKGYSTPCQQMPERVTLPAIGDSTQGRKGTRRVSECHDIGAVEARVQNGVREKLYSFGFTPARVDGMTSKEAHEIINAEVYGA